MEDNVKVINLEIINNEITINYCNIVIAFQFVDTFVFTFEYFEKLIRILDCSYILSEWSQLDDDPQDDHDAVRVVLIKCNSAETLRSCFQPPCLISVQVKLFQIMKIL